MKYRTRTFYTDSQKALMRERWGQGWMLHQIAQLFNRAHASVQGILARTGGIRPPQRSRSPMALTLAEREEISRGVVEGQSIRSLAARVGRARHIDAVTVGASIPLLAVLQPRMRADRTAQLQDQD